MPGELVRIYADPQSGQIAYRHRSLADARGEVACVLAAIDRELLVQEIIRRMKQDKGSGTV
jgi:hypothetical protein